MAKFCVGHRFMFHFNSLFFLAFLFGLALSSQFEIKEISELIDDFEDNTEKYFFEQHGIVRRAAPTNSTVRPSATSGTPSKGVTTRILSPSVTQAASTTTLGSTGTVPTTGTLPPVTTRKSPPTTSTTHATSERTTPDHRPPSRIPSEMPEYSKDDHKYYTSHYYSKGRQWWFNLDDSSIKPKFHYELSKNIQFSDLLQTSFIFPYYGHLINNVTVTTKGYVFLGKRLHKFNASAQYAAPLMADFNTHDTTSIRYVDTGDRLTVEWANMTLKGEPQDKFSFQCTIFKNGTLVFSYKNVPKAVDKLKKNNFYVRVGFSDTYRRERIVYGHHTIDGKNYSAVRFIIYYLYDRVNLPKDKVLSGSAFVIVPFPNCVIFNSCDTCLNTQTKFVCRWCPKIQRCSDGIDRHRMEWETAGCLHNNLKSCSSDSSLSGGVIAVVVILLLVIILVFAWFVYAYSHPQTKSGLCLIKYGNPTKWCRNSSGESRSTSTDGRIGFKTMAFESNA